MDVRDVAQYVTGFVPTDLSAAAVSSDIVNCKNANHVEVIICKAAGASGEPPTFTFNQCTAVAGTGRKAINFTKINLKVGTQTGVGAPTLTTQASGNTYTPAAGNTEVLAVVEFEGANFDVANGFNCLEVTVADVGSTAQLACVIFRLSECRVDAQRGSFIA